MGKNVLKIQRSKASEIKKMLRTNEDYLIGSRLLIVFLVALGHSSRKLSVLHNISFKQVTNWVHRYEKKGIEGLRDLKGRGRRSALSEEQLNRIQNLVLKETPGKHGFKAPRWTGPLLAKWIEQEYGLEYQKAQIYNMLDKMGIGFEKKRGLVKRNS